VAALAIDYTGPLVLYWVPSRPPLGVTTWDVESSHFAERFQLFMIIALGESIVVTGATTARLDLNTARITALGLAFLMTAAFWWLYFTFVARIAQRRLELSPDRTRLARNGYTYLHVVMVAGIIVAAVGDELVIAHPTEELPTAEILAVVAGPAIYLLGLALFRLAMAGSLAGRRVVGAAACLAVGVMGPFVPAIVLATTLVVVLVTLIGVEEVSARRRDARGEPSPLDLLEGEGSTRELEPDE
jgi:low temperature requirement protein LtrA